ncbi:MAG: GHKL domain-containing protein [Magnetococcales bacterium]|nr:GHKL domain-containing protein [Magnetococcales bacterium]MBF0414660.1 GHKL domain-containing protein [Magnetococcales bacterium]MBF0420317.1 GHKL domain-containing protein [Magnetococcales bacterium]MBF0435613.1 GHKL domain-containing protein [Magnetococcales bacterium]
MPTVTQEEKSRECHPFSLNLLWDHIDLALLALDNRLIVQNVNAASERMFGKTHRWLVGQPIESLLPGYPVALDLIQRAQILNMPFRSRNSRISPAPDRLLSVSLTVVPLRQADGQPVGTLLQLEEMSDSERLEEGERLNETLDSLGFLAMSVAHEVKNPLAGIRGAAQLIEMQSPNPAATTCTQLIRSEVDRISRLLDSLLGLADNQPVMDKETNIHEILNHVQKVIGPTIPEPVIDFDPSLPFIRGDRDQLVQLFLNILQNALEAVRHTPNPMVSMQTRISDRIRFEQGRRRKQIIIEIQDNGPGIPDEMKKKIFLPLVTTKSKGTGLGLTICRKIVHEHNGQIEVESHSGRTIFRIFLPIP